MSSTTASLSTIAGSNRDSAVGSKVLVRRECSFCTGLVCNSPVGVFHQSKMVSCKSRLSCSALTIISFFAILTANLALPLLWLWCGDDVVWVNSQVAKDSYS